MVNCPVDEYINGDNDVAICVQYDEDWEEQFFSSMTSSVSEQTCDQEEPEEDEQFDLDPPPPKITRYQDAISSLEDVRAFLDSKGCSEEATKIAPSIDTLHFILTVFSDRVRLMNTLLMFKIFSQVELIILSPGYSYTSMIFSCAIMCIHA